MVWLSGVTRVMNRTTELVERGERMDVGTVETAVADGRLLEALEAAFPETVDFGPQRERGTVADLDAAFADRASEATAESYGVTDNGLLYVLALCADVIRATDDLAWAPAE